MTPAFDNPLVYPIRQLLCAADGAVSEHELIKQLHDEIDALPELADSPRLALFQTHFLVMNALYRLQEELAVDNIYLQVSPLAIGLQVAGGAPDGQLVESGSQQQLKDYYLDWSHFKLADEQSVENLLAGFWQHYMANDKQVDAYQCLQLESGAGWDQVKKAYRRLAADCHPDRGGDPAQFVLIRQAYEVLARTTGPRNRQRLRK